MHGSKADGEGDLLSTQQAYKSVLENSVCCV